MTVGLTGIGTEADPWLISSAQDLVAVVRDANSSGFYRLTADISTSLSLSALATSAAEVYKPKVIDGEGYTIIWSISVAPVAFAGIHWRNLTLKLSIFGSGNRYLLYRSYATDVALYVAVFNTGTVYTFYTGPTVPSLLVPRCDRVLLMELGSPLSPLNTAMASYNQAVSEHCYFYRVVTNVIAGFTRRSSPLTLHDLDALAGNGFSGSGWWQSADWLYPFQAEQVGLTVQTLADGAARSRKLWLESERSTRLLGETDAAGVAQVVGRVRKWSSFTVLASEDFGADELRINREVLAGATYLPPAENGFVYIAAQAGHITNLAGVEFSDQPVTIDGLVFTPRPAYRAVMSSRQSVQRNGLTQSLLLDNAAGGGGPVISGDPAFLDGVVEEIHPMTGARQALANCEVVAFERRGSAYVAMGNTFSDGAGGFRLETDIYGGGDVFAFAADFPGVIFQPGVPLNVGDRIRPALANGYVYEIVQPGSAGASEPVWWPDQGGGTEGAIGTARARARPYYQPVGHGPLKMTLIE